MDTKSFSLIRNLLITGKYLKQNLNVIPNMGELMFSILTMLYVENVIHCSVATVLYLKFILY